MCVTREDSKIFIYADFDTGITVLALSFLRQICIVYKTNRKNEGMKNISLKSKCMKTYTNVNVYKRIPIYLGTFFCCTPIFNIFWLKYYRNGLVLNKQKLLYWVLTLDQARESTLCSKSQLFCVCVNVVRVFNSRTFKRKVIECS